MEENTEQNTEDIEQKNNETVKINEAIEKIKKPRTPAQIAAYTRNFEKRRLKKQQQQQETPQQIINKQEPTPAEKIPVEPYKKRNVKYQVIQYFDDDDVPEYIKNPIVEKQYKEINNKYNPLIEDYLKRRNYKFS